MDDNAPFFYRKIFAPFVFCVAACSIVFFVFELQPLSSASESQEFVVEKGSGLSFVAQSLQDKGIIRSAFMFKVFSLGHSRDIKPGTYEVSPSQSPIILLQDFLKGPETAHVTIPEGSSLYDVDAILATANVSNAGDIIAYAKTTDIEGRLFPDTYDFPYHSDVKTLVTMMTDNFENKAAPILAKDEGNAKENLIIASLLEKEVVSDADRRIVAGIIKKRLKAGMPLQIDATVCYAKRISTPLTEDFHCYPLSPLDFKRSSPYNTYLHRGLPPGPIGSPGVSALESALSPEDSPYWYYLSDPVSHRTIFSITLDEQSSSRAKYLKL